MPRLFIAIDLPEEYKDPLALLHDEHLSARWTPRAQYHLTLRFIGDVVPEQVISISEALTRVAMPSFTLSGQGLDVFPSRRRPKVVFATIHAVPALNALHRAIERALSRLGLEAEMKPFHPHITLARLKRASPASVRAYLRKHTAFAIPPFTVTQFHLYESILHPDGALHQRLLTIALQNDPESEREPRKG